MERFPKHWSWFFDDFLPTWVKDHYSPKSTWKGRPFDARDLSFFLKGVRELSDIFTQAERIGNYFQHAKYRSSYLLYFLPLQCAKFLSLFERHGQALRDPISKLPPEEPIRIADLGSGPATASLAFVLWCMEEFPDRKLEIHLVDHNRLILEDGKKILLALHEHFPRDLAGLTVTYHVGSWSLPLQVKQRFPNFDLVLLGHVLNETDEKSRTSHDLPREWISLLESQPRLGTLIVEPADRASSQKLSSLRDSLLHSDALPDESPITWAAPCPHLGACPLSEGRDWCHFSFPVEIPGKWFQKFSMGLRSKREWLKFSYFWFQQDPQLPPRRKAMMERTSERLVLTDLLGDSKSKPGVRPSVLLCEPERSRRLELSVSAHTMLRALSDRGQRLGSQWLNRLGQNPLSLLTRGSWIPLSWIDQGSSTWQYTPPAGPSTGAVPPRKPSPSERPSSSHPSRKPPKRRS